MQVLREEMEGDLFLHCWATTQQLMAAIDFNDFRDPKIVAAALTMSIALLDSPEGAVIQATTTTALPYLYRVHAAQQCSSLLESPVEWRVEDAYTYRRLRPLSHMLPTNNAHQ